MSIERGLLAVLLALAVLASPALAQEPEPPVPEEEALGDVPVDAAEPGEPPRPVDDDGSTVGDDPDDPLGEETTEAGLGSYFLTSFALAGANDRVSGSETVTIPGTRPPGQPTGPVGPPTVVTRDLETDETGWLVRPSFLFVHRPSARGGVVVAYEPEFEQLDRGDSPDRISHSAGLTFEHRATRRTELSAGASYLDSFDPSRHLGGDSFVLTPDRFEQQRLYGGFTHRLTRATRFHLFGEYSSAESALETAELPLDVTDLSGTLALEQAIGRKSNLTVSYSYTETELDGFDPDSVLGGGGGTGDDELGPDRFSGPVEAFRVGFAHRPSARFSFLVAGGALREEDVLTSEEETTWIGSGEVARTGDVLTMRLRYDRSLFAFGGADVALADGVVDPGFAGTALRDTVADTFSFHLEAFPPGRVRWEQSIWLSRRSVLEGDDVDSLVSATLVELLLTGGNAARVGMFARFDYFDRGSSELLGESLSRQRFSLGLRVGLSGPQTKVAHRLAVDELRKVLPNGGRL